MEASQLSHHALTWLLEAGYTHAHIPVWPAERQDPWLRSCGVAVSADYFVIATSASEATPDAIRQLRMNLVRVRCGQPHFNTQRFHRYD